MISEGEPLTRYPQLADPLISVCIPAYNRSALLGELLESIFAQSFEDFEVVVVEDASPERERIRTVVEQYSQLHPGLIRYFENSENLGYDGNLRRLVAVSRGKFVMFFGNDDAMAPGALPNIASVVARFPSVGVIIRTYAVFEAERENVVDVMRYFADERFIPAGREAVAVAYRRSVVISGLTIRREEANRWATDHFDGTLLYQLYLVANVLCDFDVVFTPQVIALYRAGGVPDFGNAQAERGIFVPRDQTVESSVGFMEGMIRIAKYVEAQRGVFVSAEILHDIANYCLPVLLVQANRPLLEFLRYSHQLGSLGLRRFPMFYISVLSILMLRPRGVLFVTRRLKRLLGATPLFGFASARQRRS